MDYFHVEFAMPGFGELEEAAHKPAEGINVILRKAGDMLVQKRFPAAINMLEEAVEAYPSSIELHRLLAGAYIETKRLADAKRELDRLGKLGAKEPQLAVRLAANSLGKRQFEDAIFYFREAERLGAPPGDWTILLGNALRATGRLEEAEEVYQEVTPASDPARYNFFFGMSAIRLQQERYFEAIELAMHALKKTDKPKTRVLYFLGLAFMRIGESEQALEGFRNFIRIEPKQYVAPYRWLERLAREAGDDVEADAMNLKARELLENRRLLRLKKRRREAK